MSISLSSAAYKECFAMAEQYCSQLNNTISHEPIDRPHRLDYTLEYPKQLGQGHYRYVELRKGLELEIAQYQPCDHLIVKLPERSHPVEYQFMLSGLEFGHTTSEMGQYSLYSSGIAPSEHYEVCAQNPVITLNVHIAPELFQQYWADDSTQGFDLLGKGDQPYSVREGRITSEMYRVIRQVWYCPYQGMTKWIYLESKVWELMALLVEQISPPSQSIPALVSALQPKSQPLLKPDDVDRIHQAREILQRQINDPPSLIELARRVGLNDCTLKRGFRQVFGQTAFGYLHEYRLDQARQLLEEQQLNVSEVAHQVGFANRSYFASAFRKRFGTNPKDYMNRKNSA